MARLFTLDAAIAGVSSFPSLIDGYKGLCEGEPEICACYWLICVIALTRIGIYPEEDYLDGSNFSLHILFYATSSSCLGSTTFSPKQTGSLSFWPIIRNCCSWPSGKLCADLILSTPFLRTFLSLFVGEAFDAALDWICNAWFGINFYDYWFLSTFRR